MKIAVCVKRVPDTAIKIKIAPQGNTIDKTDIEYGMSPYDEIAMEHAIRLKEKMSGSEVIAVSLGPSDNEKIMRTCLAMGADRGILLEADPEADSFVIAQALSAALQGEKPDVLLFGIKAADDDNAQVGAMVATLMDMPFLTSVTEFEVNEQKVKVQSEVEGGNLVVEAPLPCAISIQKGHVDPRIPSLINIRNARKKEIKAVPTTMGPSNLKIEKMELPPDRKGGKIVGEGAQAVPGLFKLLKEEAKIL